MVVLRILDVSRMPIFGTVEKDSQEDLSAVDWKVAMKTIYACELTHFIRRSGNDVGLK